MGKGSPEFRERGVNYPVSIRRLMKPGSLQPSTGRCAFCTDSTITFLDSPFPYLTFDIIIGLVQTGTEGKGSPEFRHIYIFILLALFGA